MVMISEIGWLTSNFPDRDCNELLGRLKEGHKLTHFGQPFDGVGSLTSVFSRLYQPIIPKLCRC